MTCIMIVDDDDLLVKTMEFALEKEGYEVISALSGADALRRLKTDRPDLVLLDIMMPGFDGWRTLEEIKTDDALASLPIMMFTVRHPTPKILKMKDRLGFKDYVTKPFDLKDLYARINIALHS